MLEASLKEGTGGRSMAGVLQPVRKHSRQDRMHVLHAIASSGGMAMSVSFGFGWAGTHLLDSSASSTVKILWPISLSTEAITQIRTNQT